MDEYKRYYNSEQVYGFTSALAWWLEETQQKTYPSLSKMAVDILSIPAMSAEPERLFSGAKITIKDRRNRLGSDVIEALECLKSWFGYVIFRVTRFVQKRYSDGVTWNILGVLSHCQYIGCIVTLPIYWVLGNKYNMSHVHIG
ncbi:hypothetical protein V3481_012206 [Fusarium oxysporum f. sp. vasinfectum]